MRRLFLGIALFLLMDVLASTSGIIQRSAESMIIIVPDDFPTIQEAINNANVGDTIFVKVGIYYESVVVNKSVSLIGENRIATIVDGNNTGNVLNIKASNVTISGFTVQRSSAHFGCGVYITEGNINNNISNNIISENHNGISLYDSKNNILSRNKITENWIGIRLDSSPYNIVSANNKIAANSIEANHEGIRLTTSKYTNIYENSIVASTHFGIYLDGSYNNNIFENSITTSNLSGIFLDFSDHNNIFNNNITSNEDGIRLDLCSYHNRIFGNSITNNGQGVHLRESTDDSIYHNNFINNTIQAKVTEGYTNIWDYGYPSGGNYWNDYIGNDTWQGHNQDLIGSDGIGDTAYNKDRYPLMGMFSSFNTSLGDRVNLISNSSIDYFGYFELNNTIRIHISDITINQTHGFVRISIPHILMYEPYNVTIDGANPTYWNYALYDNDTHRWIYFEYVHSTLEILIVPEFHSPLILSLLLLATLLVTILRPTRGGRF